MTDAITGNIIPSTDTVINKQMEMTLFNNNEDSKCVISEKDHISNCDYLKRLAHALNQYDLYCRKKIEKEEFMKFCQETYTDFLDDYCHFMGHHNYHLIQIKHELESEYALQPCIVSDCKIVDRHYRSRDTKDNNEEEEYLHFIETFDRLHHHIWHLFEMGLRVDKSDIIESRGDDKFQNAMFDEVFKNTKQRIYERRQKFGSKCFERFESLNNKFTLKIEDMRDESGIVIIRLFEHLCLHKYYDVHRDYFFRCCI